MIYPLISEYVEAIQSPEDNFDKLIHLRPVLDDSGERLGCDNGYTGENRAIFAKKMFPIPFEKTDIKSIMNFKAK